MRGQSGGSTVGPQLRSHVIKFMRYDGKSRRDDSKGDFEKLTIWSETRACPVKRVAR
jgi:hypothetical protein